MEYLTKDEVMGAFNRILWEEYVSNEEALKPEARELPRWFGRIALKVPTDLWVYQELIYKTQPDIIIETGVLLGGTTLFLADVCRLLNRGVVIAIEKEMVKGLPEHPRIIYLEGDSTGDAVREFFTQNLSKNIVPNGANALRVMAILDSDHSYEHVIAEMRYYGKMIAVGCYMIIEDGNTLGHDPAQNSGMGPMRAINQFLMETDAFVMDRSQERFLLTYNPCGYLKKVKDY